MRTSPLAATRPTPAVPARARTAPVRTTADRWPARAGFAAAALALVPLVGWGAGWPALAAIAAGWPPVSPHAAVAFLVAGVALGVQRPSTPASVRQGAAAGAALVLLAVGVLAVASQGVRLRSTELVVLVAEWNGAPEQLRLAWPSAGTATALLFLAVAFAGLTAGRTTGLRVAYAGAAGAGVVALLAAGLAPAAELASATLALRAPATAERIVPPATAFLVLLLTSGLALCRGDDGWWWVPARGGAAAAARRFIPALLLLPPAAVWLVDLAVRRRLLDATDLVSVLPALLVLLLGGAAAHALRQVHAYEARDRDRGERRMRRQAEREAEQAAARAEATLRAASDHYRAHLRTILDVAPIAFLAVDRDGHVSYANAAAADFIGRPLPALLGHPLADAWPEHGRDVGAALATAVQGMPIERELVDRASGRRIELRGFPGDEGAAVFLRSR